MCLSINAGDEPIIAEEDIIVYKYLHQKIKADNSLGAIRTPYKKSIVKIGETYKSKLKKINDEGDYIITLGLHSFADLKNCRMDAISWYQEKFKTLYVKCVIPKGSQYYVGQFIGATSFASDTIKYLEIL